MKVTITQAGLYSDFVGPKARAVIHDAGDVVEFPDWYAQSLVKSGLAEPVFALVEAENELPASAGEPDSGETPEPVETAEQAGRESNNGSEPEVVEPPVQDAPLAKPATRTRRSSRK